jgi:BMFP domain-containing protein YqiC
MTRLTGWGDSALAVGRISTRLNVALLRQKIKALEPKRNNNQELQTYPLLTQKIKAK